MHPCVYTQRHECKSINKYVYIHAHVYTSICKCVCRYMYVYATKLPMSFFGGAREWNLSTLMYMYRHAYKYRERYAYIRMST